ncbi:MgtC/SapB family protein [Rubinisphaera italica]|nr:MgtC/SapB family protein [Rubinisphaera italica]
MKEKHRDMEFKHEFEICMRLLAAVIAGGVVGWERGTHEKSAGLRTHMLVALGSAAFTLISIHTPQTFEGFDWFKIDPTRVIQGIIGGVGFLGAGAIFRRKSSVHGLTTASGIWVIAAVGIACGFGYYAIALPVVVLTVIVNGVLVFIDPKKKEDQD